jgi:hypothetical protein
MRSFGIAPGRMKLMSGLSVRNTRPCVRPPYSNEVHLPIAFEVELIIELETNPLFFGLLPDFTKRVR